MSIETFKKAFHKKYGKENLISAEELISYKPEIIPICPMLNVALNGGIPEGSRVLIAGKSGIGKSTISLAIAKNAIEQDRPIFFLAIEGRFREQTATAVKGLDPAKINIICSSEKRILYGEDYLSIATQILSDIPRAIVILDSLSYIYPSDITDAEVSAKHRPSQPKMIGDFLGKVSNIIPVQKSVLISIAHTYKTQGIYASWEIKGGRAPQEQADIVLRCTSAKDWTDGDDTIGSICKWKVLKTAIGAPHSGDIESYIRFGYGPDYLREIFELAKEQGLIIKGGAWHTFAFDKEQRFQGEHKALQELKENKALFDKLASLMI